MQQLKRQGWGQHKIDRWLAQRTAARTKMAKARDTDRWNTLDEWYVLIREILKNRLSPYICLAVVWSRHGIKGRTTIRASEDFAPLKKDTVYEFSLAD
jgi:hypothetical protein